MVPAVAVKVADVAAAATVTEAGTGKATLLLLSATVAPPAGAPPFRVTVQVEVPALFREVGRQDTEATVGEVAPPVTVPPVAVSRIPVPAGEDATLLLTPIAVVLRPVAMVRFIRATGPFEMMLVFIPEATQVYVPEPAKQFIVLLAAAAVRDEPGAAEMAATLVGGNVNVNWIAAGSLPEGEVNARVKATVPLAAAVPDDKASESGPVCPKETRASSRVAIAKVDAMWPRV